MLAFPQTDLEALDLPDEALPEINRGALKLGIVGAGQAGVRLAEALRDAGYQKVFGINTTTQDKTTLDNFLLLQTPGHPGGAGKDPSVARTALNSYTADVFARMSETFGDVDHIFICLGLGGGTGSGCAEPLVDLATRYLTGRGIEDAGKRVGVIAALPKASELLSPQVARNAKTVAERLSPLAENGHISPFILVDNAKIEQLYRNQLTPARFYPTINSNVAQLLDVFNQVATTPSDYITFDGRDFQKVMQAAGHMTMGVTVLKDVSDVATIAKTIQANFERTLLTSDLRLGSATEAAVVLVVGQQLLEEEVGLMDRLEHVYNSIGAQLGAATVFRGLYSDPESNSVRVYTLIGGLETPSKRYARLR